MSLHNKPANSTSLLGTHNQMPIRRSMHVCVSMPMPMKPPFLITMIH